MSKPSLRQTILVRSVQKLLDADETVSSVVVMFTRHRWFVPYSVAAAVVLFGVSSASGITSLTNRLVLAVCGLAIAGIATTNYWVLAETNKGLALCRSSRIRQYAKSLERRLPAGTELTMAGSTVITSDWRVDGVMYTLTKRWEATMRRLSTEAANRRD